MKAYGSVDQLHIFLASALDDAYQLHAPATLPSGTDSPVPNEKEAGWAPQPSLTISRTENILALMGNV